MCHKSNITIQNLLSMFCLSMNSQEITPGHLNIPKDKQDTYKKIMITQYNFICIFKYNLINLVFMFIKYIMQLRSTIQKFEYDFVPVWIAQMVPIP